MLTLSTSPLSVRRAAAMLAAAAFVAAAFVQFAAAPRAASSPAAAGESMMRMLGDEHAAVAAYLAQQAAARSQADQAAARDLDHMKLAALAEAQPVPLRLAQAPVRDDKAKAGIARVAAKSEPVRAANQVAVTQASPVAAGAPMQLLAATEIPPPQSRAGAVRGKLRQLASTVERIPSWVGAAAGWVVEAVPSLPSLPLRNFRV